MTPSPTADPATVLLRVLLEARQRRVHDFLDRWAPPGLHALVLFVVWAVPFFLFTAARFALTGEGVSVKTGFLLVGCMFLMPLVMKVLDVTTRSVLARRPAFALRRGALPAAALAAPGLTKVRSGLAARELEAALVLAPSFDGTVAELVRLVRVLESDQPDEAAL